MIFDVESMKKAMLEFEVRNGIAIPCVGVGPLSILYQGRYVYPFSLSDC